MYSTEIKSHLFYTPKIVRFHPRKLGVFDPYLCRLIQPRPQLPSSLVPPCWRGMPPTFADIRKAGYRHQLHYRDVTYFSLSWFDIISTTVMWHTFHYRDVTYFSLPWCDILFTTVMWHTFNYREVTYFSIPWCDILSSTVMWHTFHCRDVTYFSQPWCDILSTTLMWHTLHCRDVTYFPLAWCDILFTTVMRHTFNYWDVTYFHCRDVTYCRKPVFFFLWKWLQLSHNSLNDWHDITEIDVICLTDIIIQWKENVWQTKVRLRRMMTDAKF